MRAKALVGVAFAAALALVEPACNTVAFHFHEKVWTRIEARRNLTSTPRIAA